jgi:hypothetical protein
MQRELKNSKGLNMLLSKVEAPGFSPATGVSTFCE